MNDFFYHEDSPLAGKQPKPDRLRFSARLLLTCMILGMALYLLIPQLPSVENALHVAGQMSVGLILLAILTQVGSYMASGYLMQATVLLVNQRISISRGIVVTLAANSVSMLVGGTVMAFAMTYRWMRSSGVNSAGARFACTLPWVFNNLVLILFALAGLLHLAYRHKLTKLEALSFLLIGLLLGLLVLAAAWGIRYRDHLTHFAHRISRQWAAFRRKPYNAAAINSAIAQLFEALHLLHEGGWRRPLVGAALNNGLDALMLYILFVAAGYPLGIGTLLTGYGLPLLVGKVGLLPGGLGIVETSMAVIYGSLGAPNAVLVVVILVYRLLAFWMPTVLGFLLVPYLQHTSRTVAENEQKSGAI